MQKVKGRSPALAGCVPADFGIYSALFGACVFVLNILPKLSTWAVVPRPIRGWI
ncbi:hypothetical protein JXI42_14880 [bacterium]|nr:hypothetical protein [bacterium]